ncbi:MAG: hypothetical protein VKK62_04505 [Synechococcaceae cyanobacterium]|nr:hypothetical protein [Synechococcaceae cyanobacterium]
MAAIPDRAYNAACGRLASRLSISLAAARRKVDIRAAQEGLRDVASRIALAERMLEQADSEGVDNSALFTELLQATAEDDQFMTED